MKFFHAFETGIFKARPNRFVIECMINHMGVRAYLPNPGRLRELLLPDSRVYLVKQSSSAKMEYMCVAVEKGGAPVFLHTHLNNAVARYLIEQNRVPGLEGADIVRPEITVGGSRFDFLLRKDGEDILLEVKSCTLFHGSIAMFPDAETARGRKHLRELASLSEGKRKSAVLFVVHSHEAKYFLPEYHTDLDFSNTLLSVSGKVMVKAVAVQWNRDLSLEDGSRDLHIPWGLIRQESHDSGSYIVILYLKKKKRIATGSLGEVQFPGGYYLYAGSAKNSLSKRIARHQRKRKNHFWHIDYLRQHTAFCASLPVRSGADLECDIAGALENISQWNIPCFGSSDCACGSHLFGMQDNPLQHPAFINMLLHFRMGRLEKLIRE
jgi:sugar fermentation stimulation protein A